MEFTVEQKRALALAAARKRLEAAAKDFRGAEAGAGTGLEAALIGARQGVTLGFGDEINAGVRAVGDMIGGQSFGEAYDARLAHERGLLAQTRREDPVASMAGEITGAALLPGGAATTAKTAGGAIARSAAASGAFGGAYGAGESEGAADRLAEGAKGMAMGSLFGAGAATAITYGTRGFRRIMGRAMQKPTVEGLRAAKAAAYRAVDDAGEVFDPAELTALHQKASQAIDATNYVADTDTQTRAVLTLLERNSTKPLTMGQLDKLRQSFWRRYNAAPEQVGILDAIDAIDELVASRGSTSDLVQAARAANSQYKKAELLDRAFKKAEDQTASTGSGGNILNKYRQAVTAIVNDPKRAKWFTQEELATMQKVIDGSFGENVLRRIGKMAPSGNGLMTFLNVLGGVTVGPEFLAVAGVGAGAKAVSDASARAKVDALTGRVMGAQEPPPIRIPTNALTGYLGSQ